MPDSKTIVDIATLNANYANLKESVDKLAGKVDTGNQQNAEIIRTLGAQNKQMEFTASYQEKCDSDRDDIRRDIDAKTAALHSRITANTTAISRMSGKSAGIALAVSTIIGIATLWVEFLHR